ncbi:hypothetical protein Moror_11096 [Moniliophthora roreri MCA 2997]|uniref:Uncharacterized protein n=2 Tax=Moniliophthora roreri TaxID=221103 RepID=V2WTA7_MONRO|nr:hypothetical protein Moror_11096 [Moniliophthora roreri MCA 2997]
MSRSRIIIPVVGGICTIGAAVGAAHNNSPAITTLTVVSGLASLWGATPPLSRNSVHRIVKRKLGAIARRVFALSSPAPDIECGVEPARMVEMLPSHRPFRMKPRPKTGLPLSRNIEQVQNVPSPTPKPSINALLCFLIPAHASLCLSIQYDEESAGSPCVKYMVEHLA